MHLSVTPVMCLVSMCETRVKDKDLELTIDVIMLLWANIVSPH